MPLETGKSKAAFSHNVAAEINSGRPKKQAVAIAYSEKRGDKRIKDSANAGLPIANYGEQDDEGLEEKKSDTAVLPVQALPAPGFVPVSPAAPIYDAVPRDSFGASSASSAFKGRTF